MGSLSKQIGIQFDTLNDELARLKEKLNKLGVCTKCYEIPVHNLTEPFSSCGCGTGEDYAYRKLQAGQCLADVVLELASREKPVTNGEVARLVKLANNFKRAS